MSEVIERAIAAVKANSTNSDLPDERVKEIVSAVIMSMRDVSPKMLAAAWTVFNRHPRQRLGPRGWLQRSSYGNDRPGDER